MEQTGKLIIGDSPELTFSSFYVDTQISQNEFFSNSRSSSVESMSRVSKVRTFKVSLTLYQSAPR